MGSSPSEPERVGTVARVALGVTVAIALWLLVGVVTEGLRMVQGTPMSPLHAWMVDHRIHVADVPCERVAPPGTNPFLRPLGHCEHLGQAYAKAPAYAIFTRHSVKGSLTAHRAWTATTTGMRPTTATTPIPR